MKTMIKAATPLFSHIKISALALLLLISMNGYCKTESAMTMEKKNGYTIYTISYPNKKFYLSWIFTMPGQDQCTPFLIERFKTAQKVLFASYKPTHPKITKILDGNSGVSGYYDGWYCRKCSFKNSNIRPIKLKEISKTKKRRWSTMHHKFAVISKSGERPYVITGSFNWNTTASKYSYDNMISTDHPVIVRAFEDEFGNMGKAANPVPSQAGDGKIHVAFNQACDDLLIPYIRKAKKTIHIAMYILGPSTKKHVNPVYDEILMAIKRGVKVKIIADAKEARERKLKDLPYTGAVVKKGFFHHKFMVIDKKIVATGSFNYGYGAMNGNNEALVIIEEPEMAKSYMGHWKILFKRFK